MYFITLVPHLVDPIAELERIKKKDQFFYNWVIKWSARYICKEYSRGIQKFAQALRVRDIALRDIEPKKLKQLQKYFKANHPGHRSEYEGEEEE